MKKKNDFNKSKRHQSYFEVSKIPQLDSSWSFYFIKFRCRLEIFLSFSKNWIILLNKVLIKNKLTFVQFIITITKLYN